MNLTDERGHRALAYVAAVSKHGHLLTRDELDEYARAPSRQTGRSPVFDSITRALASGMVGFAAGPGEATSEWLERLGWTMAIDGTRVGITPLGKAVLAALDEDERLTDDLPPQIVLDPRDPLAYARVVGVIAEAGRAALVDPYFDLDRLMNIVQNTSVDRILTAPDRGGKKRLTSLKQAFTDLAAIDRALELRSSDAFHDRLVIAEDGRVWSIGTSLNSVGKRLSVMTSFDEGAISDALQARFEEAWTNAELVAAITPAAEEPVASEPPAAAAHE